MDFSYHGLLHRRLVSSRLVFLLLPSAAQLAAGAARLARVGDAIKVNGAQNACRAKWTARKAVKTQVPPDLIGGLLEATPSCRPASAAAAIAQKARGPQNVRGPCRAPQPNSKTKKGTKKGKPPRSSPPAPPLARA